MPRDIDEKKKRKALRKLRKAADLAARGEGPKLSDWEKEFLQEVEERIETFGSAFADPDKGNLDDPMSALQTQKLREIDKKARGKGGGFKTRKPLGAGKKPAFSPRIRQLDDDVDAEKPAAPPRPEPGTKPILGLVKASELPDRPEKPVTAPTKRAKPVLRLIKSDPDDT
ncbi:hypothetical protein [Henriciella litoralis]|uniref:hypothetical protein n=1 Tax=Henriciella litoralis TaxID=568102 RepID=UPI000A076F30|nr:hypothetical protein [Henriciella litoralis]